MTLYGIRGGQMVIDRLGYDPYIFAVCIVVYVIIHVAYHYMGQHGISWEMRNNNKKVKINRIPL